MSQKYVMEKDWTETNRLYQCFYKVRIISHCEQNAIWVICLLLVWIEIIAGYLMVGYSKLFVMCARVQSVCVSVCACGSDMLTTELKWLLCGFKPNLRAQQPTIVLYVHVSCAARLEKHFSILWFPDELRSAVSKCHANAPRPWF